MQRLAKRILFLHPSAELYGADRTLLDLVVSLPDNGFDVLVALPREGPLSEALRSQNIPVEVGPLGVAAMGDLNASGLLRLACEIPRAVRFVRRLARTFRPDIIHTNTMVVLGGAIGAKSTRATHLWHIHEIPTSPSWLPALGARLFHALADSVVWNSQATGHTFLRHHKNLGRKCNVIHNGIDRDRLIPFPDQTAARRRLGWPSGVPIALLLGRINSWKGQDLAVQALSTLRESHPDLHLAIVGSPPAGQRHFEEQLHDLTVASGLESRILRHGFDSDVARFYSAADFLLLPSTRPEPFGLVVLEAFAAGRAVIAAGHGGPMEIVRPDLDGLLFEPGCSQALAACMARLLDKRSTLQHMGQRARERQRTHFSLQAYQTSFKELYRALPTNSTPHPQVGHGLAWPSVVHIVLGKANPERMNGVNRFVHGLADHQQNNEGSSAEVWGLCKQPDAPTPPRRYRLLTFPRYRLRTRVAPGLLARMRQMAETPEKGTPVFHLHGAFLPEMACIAGHLRRLGLAYVFTPHGAYVQEAMGKSRALKAIYSRALEAKLVHGARAIQALSTQEALDLKQRFPSANVVCIAPGQDLEQSSDFRTAPASQVLRIGSLGRIDQHTKGLDSLIEGLAHFVAQGGQAHLSIAGDGPDLVALQQHAQTLNLSEHITWVGEIHRQEKRRFFREIDLYAQLSRHEGLPGAPLEAAAHGCPLLVTAATHLGSLIEKHKAGWVLPSGNRDTVVAALKMVAAQSDEEWKRTAQGAREMVRQEYSWDRTTRAMHAQLYGLPLDPPSKRNAA